MKGSFPFSSQCTVLQYCPTPAVLHCSTNSNPQYGGDGRQYAAGGLPSPPQWGYEEEGYGGAYGEDEEGELDNRAG